MKTHFLKITPQFFLAQIYGTKNFEIRKADRNFNTGDIIVLQEIYNSPTPVYTGRKLELEITYTLRDYAGIVPGFVILGTKILDGQ